MDDQQGPQDPGRADFVPKDKKKKKKYTRRFNDGARVWIKVSGSDNDIVVYVKEGKYDDEKDGWVYKVQEKDKDEDWYGREVWKRETALKPA